MVIMSYMLAIVAPFLIGVSVYYMLKKHATMIDILTRASFILFVPNIICYFITMYIFKQYGFTLTYGGNILVIKYAVMNFVVTNVFVIFIRYFEKYITIKFGVETNE